MGDFIECYYFASIFGLMVGGPTTLQTLSTIRVAQRNDFQDLSKHTSSM